MKLLRAVRAINPLIRYCRDHNWKKSRWYLRSMEHKSMDKVHKAFSVCLPSKMPSKNPLPSICLTLRGLNIKSVIKNELTSFLHRSNRPPENTTSFLTSPCLLIAMHTSGFVFALLLLLYGLCNARPQLAVVEAKIEKRQSQLGVRNLSTSLILQSVKPTK